ncbi:MAG: hypothetical protein IPJ23_05810 [Ignavibacteriales bacterium]|nr:hypothetical protein [Ignavibacteriales bacterium]
MQIEFIEPASIELDDAIEYYELQLNGLGKNLKPPPESSVKKISFSII